MPFSQLTFQSRVAHFPLIFATDDNERERWKVEYVARVVRVRTLRSKIGKVKNYANLKKKSWIFSDGIWIFWLDLD